MMRRPLGWLPVALAMCVAGGCERGPAPAGGVASGDIGGEFVVDDIGDTLGLGSSRTRVVSMIPSVTDLVLALGIEDRLVGRTRYDSRPELADLPSVGGGLDPDLESLLGLAPDLVVLWPDHDLRGVGARLRDLGIPTYSARIEGIADFRRHGAAIGALLGSAARADSLLGSLDHELRAIRRSVQGRPVPEVVYVVALNPPTVAGPGTFVDSLIATAGGRNAFRDLTGNWPQVSLEEVVRRQPDFVAVSVTDVSALGQLRDAPGWRSVAAVRDGRAAAFDPNRFNRPGPGLARAARELAAWLHPEAVDPDLR